MGKFYAVGLGPGDPKLITYKAVEVLKKVKVVFVPDSGSEEQLALNIAQQFIELEKIKTVKMPMVRNVTVLNAQHDEVSEIIMGYLNKGEDVAFANLGDPSIYGSVMYIHKRLKAKNYKTKIIPGVPSFCAVAASLNESLCEREESLHIIPASYEGLDENLKLKGVKVLMKTGRHFSEVKKKILSENLSAKMVERASLNGEKVYQSLGEVKNTAGYFSIIVVK